MKAFVILTATILMFIIIGCSQKFRYNLPLSDEEKTTNDIIKMRSQNIIKPLSEDEKIMRAMLKLKPSDIIKIPPPEEKIGEYNLSLYQKTGTLSCYGDGKIIVTVRVFGDIGNNEGYFLAETEDSKIAYIRIDGDGKYFLKINNSWQQTPEDEIMKKFEWLGDLINECKEKMDF